MSVSDVDMFRRHIRREDARCEMRRSQEVVVYRETGVFEKRESN